MIEREGRASLEPEKEISFRQEKKLRAEQVERGYDEFREDLANQRKFADLRERPQLLEHIRQLHPHKEITERTKALRFLSAQMEGEGVREIVASAINRLLDEDDVLYPRQIIIEAAGKLKIESALPKLEAKYRNAGGLYKKQIKEEVIKAVSNFSWEQEEVKKVMRAGLEDENSWIVRITMRAMEDLELPQSLLDKVWGMFEEEGEGFTRIKESAGRLLAIKDPERAYQKIIELVEESWEIEEGKIYESWPGHFHSTKIEDDEEKKKEMVEAKKRRREVLWNMVRPFMHRSGKEELLLDKLNEWLTRDMGEAEDQFIMMAVADKANWGTVQAVIERTIREDQGGWLSILKGKEEKRRLADSTFVMAMAMISRHYERFKEREELQEFLETVENWPDYEKVVEAIKEGKELEVVNPPYSIGLAIKE